MSSVLVRRLVGTVALILILAGGKLLIDVVGAPPAGSYEITVQLGPSAGKGLDGGADVKVRGVLVGSIKEVTLDERAHAIATVTIWPTHVLPADVVPVVTSKTFLGEKQLELRPQSERLDEPPYLAAGDVLSVDEAGSPTEVQEFLAALEPVLDAIDPVELGMVVDTFGSFDRDDAETAGRNFDVTAELADFGARTAPEQLERFASLATLTSELATTAEDFNRLNRSMPRWVSLLPDRQADIRRNLDLLSSFSTVFADFLLVEEQAIADVLRVTTLVNGVVAGQADDLATTIHGIYRYALKLGAHGGSLNDLTEHGWFTSFTGGEGRFQEICEGLPPEIQDAAPGCVSGADPGGGNTDGDGGTAPPGDASDLPLRPPAPPGGILDDLRSLLSGGGQP